MHEIQNLYDLFKNVRDVTEPIMLIAFVSGIILNLFGLILHSEIIKVMVAKIGVRDLVDIIKQVIKSIFWICVLVVVLGYVAQVYVAAGRIIQGTALPNITPGQTAQSTPPPTPAALSGVPSPTPAIGLMTPSSTPAVAIAAPTPPAHEYKLVWFNHFDGPDTFWEVLRTDPGIESVNNTIFKQWCDTKPFDERKYTVVKRLLVAGDEQFKEPENFWTLPPINLKLPLKKKWLEIMDDERWYLYEVIPK